MKKNLPQAVMDTSMGLEDIATKLHT
jgi:hypothetical protein